MRDSGARCRRTRSVDGLSVTRLPGESHASGTVRAPGHPVDDATLAAFNPLPRSTSRSRENDLRRTLAERVSRWTKDVDHLSRPFRT